MLSNQHTDFVIGSNGHAGLSNRKTAELLKVQHTSVDDALKPGGMFTEEELESIAVQGFQGGVLVKLLTRFAKSNRVKPETRIHCLELLEKTATIGAQAFIDKMAGVIQPAQPQVPTDFLSALKALVQSEEQKLLLQATNEQLERENHVLSEAVDDLFEYSSVVRIAKFNNCSENVFKWRSLKAASEITKREIKKVPCPRFGEKNLYHHDAWRYVYPDMKLPETTTLTIRSC
jgi:hypothetical protein